MLWREVQALEEHERTLRIIANRALKEWAATINFEDHSEENVRRVAQFAWVKHDFDNLVDPNPLPPPPPGWRDAFGS